MKHEMKHEIDDRLRGCTTHSTQKGGGEVGDGMYETVASLGHKVREPHAHSCCSRWMKLEIEGRLRGCTA